MEYKFQKNVFFDSSSLDNEIYVIWKSSVLIIRGSERVKQAVNKKSKKWSTETALYIYYPANWWWEYSNLSGTRYYIDPTPNSGNKFTKQCVAARREN